MRKPAKLAKTRNVKVKPTVPADQLMLETECGECHKHFPNPTLASHHLRYDHEEK